ncbi:phospholipase [Oceanospirillaceae bacterium ASx5O]|nr:phospholipase [Oceanospirillaceae bacterium ASx5O]
MDELLDAIAALVSLVSTEKVQAVAARVRRTEASKAASTLPIVVGTPAASTVVEQLAAAWLNTEVGSDELASMLLAASHVYTKASAEQSTELVWTGPTTPFVSTRRTEQALLEIINSSKNELLITSFVAYRITSVVNALIDANARGVKISMVLEPSEQHGGTVSTDSFRTMKFILPDVQFFTWSNKCDDFKGGRVHAKIALADDSACFITSANLTEYAMNKNMEAGLIVKGGTVPKNLKAHFDGLIDTKILTPM